MKKAARWRQARPNRLCGFAGRRPDFANCHYRSTFSAASITRYPGLAARQVALALTERFPRPPGPLRMATSCPRLPGDTLVEFGLRRRLIVTALGASGAGQVCAAGRCAGQRQRRRPEYGHRTPAGRDCPAMSGTGLPARGHGVRQAQRRFQAPVEVVGVDAVGPCRHAGICLATANFQHFGNDIGVKQEHQRKSAACARSRSGEISSSMASMPGMASRSAIFL